MSWKAVNRYSQDYIDLQKKGVKFYKTPASVLQTQLTAYDEAAKKRSNNPMFVEIEASQRAFAERVLKWERDTVVDRGMAYNHYFGKAAPAKAPAKKA